MNDKEFIDVLVSREEWNSITELKRAFNLTEEELMVRICKLGRAEILEVGVKNEYDEVSVPSDITDGFLTARRIEHRLAHLSIKFKRKEKPEKTHADQMPCQIFWKEGTIIDLRKK